MGQAGRAKEDEHLLIRLGEIYATVDGARSPTEDAAICLRTTLTALGADAGFVATLNRDGHTVDVIRVTPASPNLVRLAFPITAPYPLAATLRSHRALFVASNFQLECDHPGLARIKAEDHACATLPLINGADFVLGAINITFEHAHDFSQEEKALIEKVATDCSAILAPRLARSGMTDANQSGLHDRPCLATPGWVGSTPTPLR